METQNYKSFGRFTRAKGILLMLFLIIIGNVLMAQIQSAASGNWSNSATWVGGVVPGPADDVVINAAHTITVDVAATINNFTMNAGVLQGSQSFTATGNFTQSGGTYNVIGTTDIAGDVTITGGYFDHGAGNRTINISGNVSMSGGSSYLGSGSGTGNMTIGGNFTFSGGNLGSSSSSVGPITVNGTTLISTGTNKTFQGRNLIMNGGGSYTATDIFYFGSSNTKITIPSGTTWTVDLSSPKSINNVYGGLPMIENIGTMQLNGSSLMNLTGTWDVVLKNAGEVIVNGGELRMFSTQNEAGCNYQLAAGSTLNFNKGTTTGLHGDMITGAGNWNLIVSGSTVNLTGGTFNPGSYTQSAGSLQGTADVNIAGGATISGGTYNVIGTTDIGGNVTITGGYFDHGAGNRTVNIGGNVSISGGYLGSGTGTGNMTIDGDFTFSGGNLGSSSLSVGPITVNGTTLISTGTNKAFQGRNLIMNGGGSYTATDIFYFGSSNTKITIPAGTIWTVDLSAPKSINNVYGGLPMIENFGTMQLNGASLMNLAGSAEVFFKNAGAVIVNGGELRVHSTQNEAGCSYQLAAGSTLNFRSGTTSGLHGDMVTGAGNWNWIVSGATVNLTGGTFNPASYAQSAGTLQGTANVNIAGDATISGGNYNVIGTTEIAGNLIVSGGNFDNGAGTRTINVGGNLTQSGGILGGGNGAADMTIGGNFMFTGGTVGSGILSSGPIAVNGTAYISTGTTKTIIGRNLVINNEGLLNATDAFNIGYANKITISPGATWNIDLSTPKTIGNPYGSLPVIDNMGTIQLNGTSLFNLSSGLFIILKNAGEVIVGGGELRLSTTENTGTFKGIGLLNFAAGTLTQNGTISPGLSPGILTANGLQPLSASSTLEIGMYDGSGPGAGHSQLKRNGNLTLNGHLRVHETCEVPNGTYVIVELTSGTISGNFTSFDLPAGYTVEVGESNVSVVRDVPELFCPGDLVVDAPAGECSAVVNNIDPLVEGNQAIVWTLTGATEGSGNGSASGQVFEGGVTYVTYNLSEYPCETCTFTVTVNTNVVPSVSVESSATDICEGVNVQFTATPVNGGDPFFQWKVNGEPVGDNSPLFESSTLENGDVVTVEMTSSISCADPASVTSEPVTISVTPLVYPTVSISASDEEICEGTGVVFTATFENGGDAQFQWKLNGNDVGENSPVYESDALQDGDQVQLVMTSSLPCAVNPAESEVITMTVNPLPVAEISGDLEICEGETSSLTASEGASWLWNTGETTQTIEVSEEGNYSVVVTNEFGCQDETSVYLTVLPVPVAEISGNLEFCEGESSVLTVTEAASYLWSTGETTQSITVTESGIYSVVVTGENGCESAAEVSVIVFPLPSVEISGDIDLCEGQVSVLTASEGESYLWSTGETTQSISVSENGIYSVEVTDANGCSNSAEVSVTVHPQPVVEISGDLEFCDGQTSLLTATEGASYLWSTGETSQSISVSESGVYSVVVTDIFGCDGSAEVSVSVFSLPEIEISGDLEFCDGETSLLTATEGSAYLWSTGETTQSISVFVSGIYSVTVTDANGCDGFAEVNVTVFPLPLVEITGNFSFCIAASTELTATAGVSYLWSTGETTQSITVTEAGLYSVVVTDANGCEGYAEATVTDEDNQDPTITAPGDLTVSADEGLCSAYGIDLGEPVANDNCTVASVTNDAPETFPLGTTTVTWTVTDLAGRSAQDVQLVTVVDNQLPTIVAPADLTIPVDAVGEFCAASNVDLGEPTVDDNCSVESVTNDAPILFPLGTTEVTWTVVDGSGNMAQAVQYVTVISDFTAEISGDLDFCDGQSTLLTATEGVSYLWSTGETTQSITVYASAIVSVVVTAASGCEAFAEVEVLAYPIPEIDIEGDLEFCEGEFSVLTATAGVSYLWNTGETTQSITVSEAGDYSVTVTDLNGCEGNASVLVVVNPLPEVSITPDGPTTFCAGGSVVLTASEGASYLWSTGETSQSIVAADGGYYEVTVYNEFGCSASAEIFVEVIALPEVACPPTQQAYLDEMPVLLDMATPGGGVYSGEGVFMDGDDYYFDPSVGMGSYEITYCYTDPITECESCCTFIYKVNPLEQEICIPAGWSGISSYFQPDASIADLFGSLTAENKVQIMLGQSGIFWPSQNINTLNNWDVNQGYKIKMNEPGCIEVTGIIPDNRTVSLKKGASFMPVLCNQPVAAQDIFTQLGNNLLFAFDIYSQQLYWPMGGIYTLQTLEPGIGYLVNMINAGQATFNCGSKSATEGYAKAQPPVYQSAPWSLRATGSVHFISISTSALADLQKGDFIGVFNSAGICAGFTRYDGENENLLLVAFGDDFTTEVKDGLADGDGMTFRIFRPSTSKEAAIEATFNASMPNTGIFSENGQSQVIGFKAEATSINEARLSAISLYPNPSNGLITLSIPALDSSINIEVTNTSGQVVLIEKSEVSSASIRQLDLTGSNPGVYFVRITAGGQTVVKKVVIQ